ncbi:nucleotidyltransferase family protein [Actinomyces vulturis]|uniref:nucleotidyltransferase family protein n=1 Tax=Actinomyces vulturis TaxID=1857645 RepID=UPI00082C0931|nr:sugar phosphate nucleotidyltransferase [Actinomyces vulturis]
MNSPVTKAVILARGLGSRMRAADPAAASTTDKAVETGAKGMIDVGRPFLDFVMSALADAGITDICLVIGPEHTIFREHYGNLETSRVKIDFAIQEKPLGTADAVSAAREFTGDDRFVVINSDNYYPAESLKALCQLPGAGLLGFNRTALVEQSNIPADRVNAFAIVDVDENGNLARILEKPEQSIIDDMGPEAPLSMNAWLFTKDIYAACDDITPSVRGELEIVDAVSLAKERGTEFAVVPVSVGVLDMSRRTDIAAVRAALESVEVEL